MFRLEFMKVCILKFSKIKVYKFILPLTGVVDSMELSHPEFITLPPIHYPC